jgi:hypothetical protein
MTEDKVRRGYRGGTRRAKMGVHYPQAGTIKAALSRPAGLSLSNHQRVTPTIEQRQQTNSISQPPGARNQKAMHFSM